MPSTASRGGRDVPPRRCCVFQHTIQLTKGMRESCRQATQLRKAVGSAAVLVEHAGLWEPCERGRFSPQENRVWREMPDERTMNMSLAVTRTFGVRFQGSVSHRGCHD